MECRSKKVRSHKIHKSYAKSYATGRLVEALESRCLLAATLVTAIPVQSVALGQSPTLNVTSFFTDPTIPAGDTAVDIQTDLASPNNHIPLILTNAATPQTVSAFLHYISSGEYAGTVIHRSVPGFVIQGGGYTTGGTHITSFGNIPGESSTATLKNTTGTIAMALSNGPDTGTSEWFFNLQNNPQLDDTSDGGPFTAFGKVVYGGMSTLNAIANLPIVNDTTSVAWNTIPVLHGTSGATVGSEPASNLVTINPVVVPGGLTYSVSSSNSNIVTGSMSNGTLTFTPVASGTATIVVTATDLGGGTATSDIIVHVAGAAGPSSARPTIAKSSLPTAVIAGKATKGKITVDVTNNTGSTVKGPVAVEIGASKNGTIDGQSIALASLNKTLTIKAGQTLPITVQIKSLPASLTAGAYSVLAQTTDPSGTVSVSSSGPALSVAAAIVSLSETFSKVKVPANATAGAKTSAVATLRISNSGNVDSVGVTSTSLFLSPDGLAADETPIVTLAKKLTIRPGKPIPLSVPLKAFPAVAGGHYFLIARVTDPHGNVSSDTFATQITIAAAAVPGVAGRHGLNNF